VGNAFGIEAGAPLAEELSRGCAFVGFVSGYEAGVHQPARPISRGWRWLISLALAVVLVAIMLSSKGSWPVRGVVVVIGLVVIVGHHYDMRDNGAHGSGA
jgi:uncharacterized membrane protein